MLLRSLSPYGVLSGALLSVTAPAALARPSVQSPAAAANGFDLKLVSSGRPNERRFRLGTSEEGQELRAQKTSVRWTYSPIDGGPTVEVGAFGSGRKGGPKLAHVGVDWAF